MNNKGYELLFILKPQVGEDKRTKICESIKNCITKTCGEISVYHEIGLRDLATEFSKLNKGYYVQIQFEVKEGNTLDELNELFQVTEDVLRKIIVTLDSVELGKVNLEQKTGAH